MFKMEMGEAKPTTRGLLLAERFIEADRYMFDLEHCREADGWKQYDTRQDAWYFGVWVHLEARQIVTYAEGDLTCVTCPDDQHLRAELDRMAEAYGDAPPFAVAFGFDGDTCTRTEYIAKRPTVEG